MKKIFFLLLSSCMYAINGCVDLCKFTIIKDGFRNEKTFFYCNDGWHCTEMRYDLNTNEPQVITEKAKAHNEMDCVLDKIADLSQNLAERMPISLRFLDQDTKDFLLNKEFFVTDGQIRILILSKNDDTIELIDREATLEERKIYIKIKALEYAAIKKAMAKNQQQN